jgi:CubicO group peptidase (beta-lactamase class C family)
MFYDLKIAQALGVPLPIAKKHIATFMAGPPLQHDPGTTYVYSNFGYSLLGQIIEAVTGQPYDKFVAQTVLAPLGLARPRLGRTLPAHRLPDEVKYHSPCIDLSVFDQARPVAPCPYGAFNLENMDAHGRWLMSAVDLARSAAAFDNPAGGPLLNGDSIATLFGRPQNVTRTGYKPGDAYYGCGWQARDWGHGQRTTTCSGSTWGRADNRVIRD